MGFSILKCFSRREASFHLNNIGYAAALIKAVSRKACVSPPKFQYAKNSDVPLSGQFSQQRLRELSRVTSPWRRGYFSGLTQAFPPTAYRQGGCIHYIIQVEAGFPASQNINQNASQWRLPIQSPHGKNGRSRIA